MKFQKKILYVPVIGKCLYYMEHTPDGLYSPNFTQRMQCADPCSLVLIIQGATDHSCLENQSGTKYKVVLYFIVLLLKIIYLIYQKLHH